MTRLVKTYSTAADSRLPGLKLEARGDAGEVHAIVSRFGNVDFQNDVIRPGAFAKSLAQWKASGDPIPVIWSHSWNDPEMHIGVVTDARENELGLEVRYQLDIDTNPKAAQVFRLLKERRVREHSFAYDVLDERKREDGANELLELDILEVGPTLRGANPETILLGTKSAPDDDDRTATVEGVRARLRAINESAPVVDHVSEVQARAATERAKAERAAAARAKFNAAQPMPGDSPRRVAPTLTRTGAIIDAEPDRTRSVETVTHVGESVQGGAVVRRGLRPKPKREETFALPAVSIADDEPLQVRR